MIRTIEAAAEQEWFFMLSIKQVVLRRGSRRAALMGALLMPVVASGLCAGGRLRMPLHVFRVPLRFSRVSPGSAAYYAGPMTSGTVSGATGRLLPLQVVGYEVRVGVFDMQYRSH